jgi:hypothetical protein
MVAKLGKVGRLAVELRRHHLGVQRLMALRRAAISLVVLVFVITTIEIRRAFVLIWSAVLRKQLAREGPRRMERLRVTYELVSGNEVAHIARGVLINLLVVAEDEDGDIDRAQDGELVSLLEQATLALEESPRAIGVSDGAAAEGSMELLLTRSGCGHP